MALEFPKEQTDANIAGYKRCEGGVLMRSPATSDVTSGVYPFLDFIVIEDFIPSDECAHLVHMLREKSGHMQENNKENHYWHGRILYIQDMVNFDPVSVEYMKQAQCRVTAKLQEFYEVDATLYADTVQLVRWTEGSFMPAHADDAKSDYYPDGLPHRHYSSIIYLNDDFAGGELYFTKLDMVLKPKKGMLVAFTGGFHHEHGVLKVTRGERYTMPAFYSLDSTHADYVVHPEFRK